MTQKLKICDIGFVIVVGEYSLINKHFCIKTTHTRTDGMQDITEKCYDIHLNGHDMTTFEDDININSHILHYKATIFEKQDKIVKITLQSKLNEHSEFEGTTFYPPEECGEVRCGAITHTHVYQKCEEIDICEIVKECINEDMKKIKKILATTNTKEQAMELILETEGSFIFGEWFRTQIGASKQLIDNLYVSKK